MFVGFSQSCLLDTNLSHLEVAVRAPWRANINRLALLQVERRKVKPDAEVLGWKEKKRANFWFSTAHDWSSLN